MTKKAKKPAKKGTINKSSVTGRIVSDSYSKSHPKTTFKQTVMRKKDTKGEDATDSTGPRKAKKGK